MRVFHGAARLQFQPEGYDACDWRNEKKIRERLAPWFDTVLLDMKGRESVVEQKEVRALLEQVSSGELDIDEAMLKLKEAPFEDLGFAKPDYHRALRQGIGEVIYGAGKTPEQIHDIVASMVQQGQKSILITRMSSEAAEAVEQDFLIKYDKYSRIGLVGEIPEPDGIGKVVVAAAGTSDLPVAEEAAQTAECFRK